MASIDSSCLDGLIKKTTLIRSPQRCTIPHICQCHYNLQFTSQEVSQHFVTRVMAASLKRLVFIELLLQTEVAG